MRRAIDLEWTQAATPAPATPSVEESVAEAVTLLHQMQWTAEKALDSIDAYYAGSPAWRPGPPSLAGGMVIVVLQTACGAERMLAVNAPPPPEIRVPIARGIVVPKSSMFAAATSFGVRVFAREYSRIGRHGELELVYRERA